MNLYDIVKAFVFALVVYVIYRTGLYSFFWRRATKLFDKLLNVKGSIDYSRREGFLRKKFMKKLLRNMKNNDEI